MRTNCPWKWRASAEQWLPVLFAKIDIGLPAIAAERFGGFTLRRHPEIAAAMLARETAEQFSKSLNDRLEVAFS